LDSELDLMQNLQVEAHLSECSSCALAYQSMQKLRSAIKQEAAYYEPSAELTARIRSAVGAAKTDIRRRPRLAWLAAGLAALVLLGIGGLWRFLPSWVNGSALPELLLASHIRSEMLPTHLVDERSSDRHTVKPWFEGKLDFSPEVPDLSREGFVLIGGRLDYLNGRPVAALVYQRRKHIINLFVWPAGQNSASTESALTRQGYHLLTWTQGGMIYWAVSDLNEPELHGFMELMQSRVKHG
jgi:anti-sigma factor RsiW